MALKKTIEVMQAGLMMDCVRTLPCHGGITNTILAGYDVGIIAEGKIIPKITLDEYGEAEVRGVDLDEVEVGLPFTKRIVTLTPEVGSQDGSSSGSNMRISEIVVRVLDTLGLEINGQDVKFRRLGREKLDDPMLPVSGEYRMENLGWDRGNAQIEIKSDQPLPFHVLSVIKKFTVNNG